MKDLDELTNEIHENRSKKDDRDEKIKGAIFLFGITGIFLLSGFSSTLSAVKKNSPKLFGHNSINNKTDEGRELALRALGWGSLYSTAGCSLLFYGIWKFSGAKNFEEFRQKMGKALPKISKSSSPLQ